MRLAATLRFATISAGQNFWRNLAISLAAVFTMGLILLMVGGTLLGTHMLNEALTVEQDKASSIKVFLQNGVSEAAVEHLASRLAADPRVRTVHFETKEEAAQEAQDRGFGDAIEAVGHNPYPASLNLDIKQLADLPAINDMVKQQTIVEHGGNGVQATNYDPNVIPKLQRLILFLQLSGAVLALVLGAISLVIIMTTIRTAVSVRRREIEIMKLVGATDWFVRLPFIIEGMLAGVLAAGAASGLIALVYHPVVNVAKGWVGFFPFSYDGAYLGLTVAVLVAAGAALGAFGSYLGVRRFLTV